VNIIIAGYGAVGKAMERALSYNPKVTTYIDDPLLNRFVDDDLIVHGVIVAVATPMDQTGACYTDNVYNVYEKYGEDVKYLVKSTIDPLWLRNNSPANTTFSPELLRGSTGVDPSQEFLDSEIAIYGGSNCRFWHELFAPVLPKLKEVRYLTLEQAAFAKYVINTFLATKVTFFNEMYRIYTDLGFDGFDAMIEAACNDRRIGHSHTQVPGPDGFFGFGGHCFPKDISALTELARSKAIDPRLLKSVIDANIIDRKRV
jgi:UDPglucose 6-dehydrogenase